ncbi:MAG TPA: bifunctional 3-(3-hydroxy-phenyl)propionate/3-hydroxycinnamic acid hydroxylase [Streptosporangiaceae bacterium]
MTAVPVVIVGAGPTGVTAAMLLAQYGVECLVLDKSEGIHPLPRAVHLDDEVYRILARLGLGAEFAAISWPGQGLRLVDRDHRVLAEFQRDTARGRHGYPQANMFDQPELEALLRVAARRFGHLTIRQNARVTALTQHDGGVRVDVTDIATGEEAPVLAEYVLGCDGANSSVRAWIGATMRDLGFTQRWLVVDVATTASLDQWEGAHQVCDPGRPATYMRVGKTRYRWEFRLNPGESAEDYREIGRLHPLIAPWTRDIPAAELEVIRLAEYTFRAQVASRWRDRRVFLLGDAAHLTPPFIGQGMGAGTRDALNLAWKLAGVLAGTLPRSVLATYEAERKPHATAMIRLAKLIGTAMTEGGEFGNVLRRAVVPRLRLLPGFKDQILSSQTPALRRSELVLRPRLRGGLAGSLCPNAELDDGRRLDEVTAGRFAIITTVRPPDALAAAIQRGGGVVLTAGQDSELHRWLRGQRAIAAVVRPDGTVLRAGRDLAAVCAALPSQD